MMNDTQTLPTDRLMIDRTQRRIQWQHQSIHLTLTQWELLDVFLRQPGTMFHTTRLVMELPRAGTVLSPETVRGYMGHLRKKLNQPQLIVIEHQHGLGYRIRPEAITLVT